MWAFSSGIVAHTTTSCTELHYEDIFPLPEEEIVSIEARGGSSPVAEVDMASDAYREFMEFLHNATYIRAGKGNALPNCHGRIHFWPAWPDTYEKRVVILVADDGYILVSQNGGSGREQPRYTVTEGTEQLCELLDRMSSEASTS